MEQQSDHRDEGAQASLVSVIIPTRNRAPLLRQAIESVLAVDRKGFALEIIVVDDGSTDETATVVAQYPVTYLRTRDLGSGGARNAGIGTARGAFIAFLDDDDVWLPGNITPQLELLVAHPAYGAALAQVTLTDPDRTPRGEPVPAGPLASGWIFDDILRFWPQLASLLVRRVAIEEVGLFDPTLRGDQDWDFVLRLARRYPIGQVAQSVALFRQRDDDDEAQLFMRLGFMLRVWRRHTHEKPMWRRLRLQRVVWRHHGWYADHFVRYADAHAGHDDHRRAWRALVYAVIASPPHALLRHRLFWRTTAALLTGRRGVPRRQAASPDMGIHDAAA